MTKQLSPLVLVILLVSTGLAEDPIVRLMSDQGVLKSPVGEVQFPTVNVPRPAGFPVQQAFALNSGELTVENLEVPTVFGFSAALQTASDLSGKGHLYSIESKDWGQTCYIEDGFLVVGVRSGSEWTWQKQALSTSYQYILQQRIVGNELVSYLNGVVWGRAPWPANDHPLTATKLVVGAESPEAPQHLLKAMELGELGEIGSQPALDSVSQAYRFPFLPNITKDVIPATVLHPRTGGTQFGTVNSSDSPDSKGKRFEVHMTSLPSAEGVEDWRFRLEGRLDEAVKKGDKMAVVGWMKVDAVESPLQAARVSIQVKHEDTSPHHNSLLYKVQSSTEDGWIPIVLPFEIEKDSKRTVLWIYPSEDSMANSMKIQLADIRVIELSNEIALADMIGAYGSYAGRDPKSPWRAVAEAAIQEHRMADFSVQVLLPNGEPAANTQVRVELESHEFGFGSALAEQWIPASKGDDADARQNALSKLQISKELFNTAIAPMFAFVWYRPQSSFRDEAQQLMDWLNSHHFHTMGHMLVWEEKGSGVMQDEVFAAFEKDNIDGPGGVQELILSHIRNVADDPHYKGRVREWQVTNHPIRSEAFRYYRRSKTVTQILTDEHTKEWFVESRKVFGPEVALYTNEAAVLSPSYHRKDEYMDYIRRLLALSTPLDGVGFQGHFPMVDSIFMLKKNISDFDALGESMNKKLEMSITEFDLKNRNIRDEHLYGDFLRDFLMLCFAHPSMKNFILWHFEDVDVEIEGLRALLRQDGSKKAGFYIWNDLVNNQWSTDVVLTTDKNGQIAFRGFKGRYLIGTDAETSLSGSVNMTSSDQFQVTLANEPISEE